MIDLILIAHNIRSIHNVGSLLRTAECLGIKTVYLTGYTPYPKVKNDPRLPHLAKKIDSQMAKTSLEAEKFLNIVPGLSLEKCVSELIEQNYSIVGLEQTNDSLDLKDYQPTNKTALIVGNERYGLDEEALQLCQQKIEIPMRGKKESLNVVQATAIAIYKLTYL